MSTSDSESISMNHSSIDVPHSPNSSTQPEPELVVDVKVSSSRVTRSSLDPGQESNYQQKTSLTSSQVIDGREGKGDAAIVQMTADNGANQSDHADGNTEKSQSEEWIVVPDVRSDDAARNPSPSLTTAAAGPKEFCVISGRESSSDSSDQAVTPTPPFHHQSEPSPQVSSTSMSDSGESCSDDDDAADRFPRAARRTCAVDALAVDDGDNHGPWGTPTSDVESPEIGHNDESVFDYYYCQDNRHKTGYASPVSDDDDEAYFACPEEFAKRTDGKSIGEEQCEYGGGQQTHYGRHQEYLLLANANDSKSHKEEEHDDTYVQGMNQRNADLSLEVTSSDLANEVLRMSLGDLEDSSYSTSSPGGIVHTPSQFARGLPTVSDESGFYDLTPGDGGLDTSNRYGRVVEDTPARNLEERPSNESPGLNGPVLEETPTYGGTPMQLCDTPDSINYTTNSRHQHTSSTTGGQHLYTPPHLARRRSLLLGDMEREQQEMERMLREARRAHEEFRILEHTVKTIAERISGEGMDFSWLT